MVAQTSDLLVDTTQLLADTNQLLVVNNRLIVGNNRLAEQYQAETWVSYTGLSDRALIRLIQLQIDTG